MVFKIDKTCMPHILCHCWTEIIKNVWRDENTEDYPIKALLRIYPL